MDWQKNSGQLKDAFDRDGFVVIPGFYTPQETAALNAHIDRFIAGDLARIAVGRSLLRSQGTDRKHYAVAGHGVLRRPFSGIDRERSVCQAGGIATRRWGYK